MKVHLDLSLETVAVTGLVMVPHPLITFYCYNQYHVTLKKLRLYCTE